METVCHNQLHFGSLFSKEIVADFSGGRNTSDDGGLLLREVDQRYVVLYTRKKRGGHLTPRKVPMTSRLYEIMSRRSADRDTTEPWVFWHRYFDQKAEAWVVGPFKDRRKIIKALRTRAGVRQFRLHALRHAGASLMDHRKVPIGSIQRILGHENRSTTEIYLPTRCEAEREAVPVSEEARQSHTQRHTQKRRPRPTGLSPI